jgi:hypothetical protein
MLCWTAALNIHHQQQQGSNTRQAQATQQQIPLQIAPPVAGKQTTEPDWGKPECANPQNHDEADLCQQRRMAKSAEDTVLLNRIQIVLGIIGAFFILWNLYYARQAGIGAMEAAKAAKESVDTLMAAERPHMIVQEIKARGLDRKPDAEGKVQLEFDFSFLNSGKTPASIQFTHWGVQCRAELEAEAHYPSQYPSRFTIAPGGTFHSTVPARFSQPAEKIAEVWLGNFSIWITGCLEYKDSFGTDHMNRFCYRLPFDGAECKRGYPDGPDEYWEYT